MLASVVCSLLWFIRYCVFIGKIKISKIRNFEFIDATVGFLVGEDKTAL